MERSRRLLNRRIVISLICFLLLVGCTENIPDKEEELQVPKPSIDLIHLIGKDISEVVDFFGTNYETGPSPFDYEWLIFYENDSQYVQVGHDNSKVVTMFIIGEKLIKGDFTIGDKYAQVTSQIPIENEIVVRNRTGEYQFELTNDDQRQRPLVKLSNDVYAQLYFDRFTETLVAVRLLDEETLLKHRPYRMIYRGDLKKYTVSNHTHLTEINRMNEKQIFYVTNVIRNQYGKSKLSWSQKVANVAFQHSQDMKQNEYFDHVSPVFGDLKNRLKNGNIAYYLAGENIASGYPDGADAVIGWLNSKDHRKTLLDNEFTHIGVGVFDQYYTQNFISK